MALDMAIENALVSCWLLLPEFNAFLVIRCFHLFRHSEALPVLNRLRGILLLLLNELLQFCCLEFVNFPENRRWFLTLRKLEVLLLHNDYRDWLFLLKFLLLSLALSLLDIFGLLAKSKLGLTFPLFLQFKIPLDLGICLFYKSQFSTKCGTQWILASHLILA